MTRMFLWDTTAVHPRIRGERPYTAHASERSAGSSPHTRGTPGPLEFTRPAARFIPAYAGNAWSASSSRARRSVHPRIRGERKSCCADRSFRRGSSPHTRGTPAGLDAGAAMTRFIPAYAGNAQWIRKRCREPPVHPRIRGERLHSCSHTGQCFGSSPHTRGTRVVSKNYLCCNPVHPRIRGERRTSRPSRSGVTGSSPHTRGTPFHRLYRFPTMRFIPAYAGNASTAWRSRAGRAVHPRIRGERQVPESGLATVGGSSPHTRGTLGRCDGCWCVVRFIPAYAGNALAENESFSRWPVHPRIRGERHPGGTGGVPDDGSSPHTRGTLCHARFHEGKFRFIPAYAGNALADGRV